MPASSAFRPNHTNVIVDLEKLLSPEANVFCDVNLVSSQAETVPAVRSLLAMRSPFFKTLLYSGFREAREPDIYISLSTRALRSVVEYAYTDEVRLVEETASSISFLGFVSLSMSRNGDTSISGRRKRRRHAYKMTETHTSNIQPLPINTRPRFSVQVIADIVKIASAADYCDMPRLTERCCEVLELMTAAFADTTCIVIEVIRQQSGVCDRIDEVFMNLVDRLRLHVDGHALNDKKDAYSGQCSWTHLCGGIHRCPVVHLSAATLAGIFSMDGPSGWSGRMSDSTLKLSPRCKLRLIEYWCRFGVDCCLLDETVSRDFMYEEITGIKEKRISGNWADSCFKTSVTRDERWTEARQLLNVVELKRISKRSLAIIARRRTLLFPDDGS